MFILLTPHQWRIDKRAMLIQVVIYSLKSGQIFLMDRLWATIFSPEALTMAKS